MNHGKYIFSQLVEFLTQRVFDRFVTKQDSSKKFRSFTCWNQLLCMIFGKLSARDSMRNFIIMSKHINQNRITQVLQKNVKESNLDKANENRNNKIFEDFANYLISIAQEKNSNDSFEIKGKIYAFDSSTIALCLSVFQWAHFRKTTAGIKLHALFEINIQIPVFINITEANIHDVNVMDINQL